MDMTILIVVVICTAVLVDTVRSVMMVVMAMAAEVNVICLAAQSSQQEPDTQTGDEKAASSQAEGHLEILPGRLGHFPRGDVEAEPEGNRDDHAGVRQRGHQPE